MQHYFTLLICMLGFQAFSQQLKTNLYPNGNKESEGVLICTDKRAFQTNLDQYSKSEQERIWASAVRDGEWKSWFESGKVRSIEHYLNGQKVGKNITYYENGNIESQINIDGSESTFFYENGTKQSQGIFSSADVMEGIWKGWHENGNLNYEANYTHGISQGITKWYDVTGKLYFEQEFVDGKMIKENKF